MTFTATACTTEGALLGGQGRESQTLSTLSAVIASGAKQSRKPQAKTGLLRRFAPRNDVERLGPALFCLASVHPKRGDKGATLSAVTASAAKRSSSCRACGS